METEVRGSIIPTCRRRRSRPTWPGPRLALVPQAVDHGQEDGTTAAGAAALADTASGAGAESGNGNGSGSAAAAANTSTEDVPDGTPIEHTPGATVPVSMPGPTDATVFGDPSLN